MASFNGSDDRHIVAVSPHEPLSDNTVGLQVEHIEKQIFLEPLSGEESDFDKRHLEDVSSPEPTSGEDSDLEKQNLNKGQPTRSDLERVKSWHDSLTRTTSDGSIVQTLSLWQEIILVAVVSMAQFATQWGVGGPLAVLHIIGHDLEITKNSQLSWLLASYSLTVGAFILPMGRLGDVFGYKRMLLIGFSWFALWTLVAGLSTYSNLVLFNFARVFQGIGPAICLPNGLAVLGVVYPAGPRKNMVFAIFGATAPLGSVVGALISSALALAWWPYSFYVFTIVLVLTTILGYIAIPNAIDQRRVEELDSADRNPTAWQQICKLDPIGSFTGVASLVLIDFAWNQAAVVGWQSPYVITALLVGVLLVPAFFYVETHVASSPLLPFECLSADIGIILAVVALGWSCFGIFLYYIWQFFLLLRHASPLLATAWYSTNGISGAIAAIITGLTLTRVGPPLAMVIAMAAYVTGSALIATAPVDQVYWAQSFLCLVIIPFGMDISFPAATVILSNALPRKHQGMGASLVNTVVNFSISLGLGFAGTVEVHVNPGGETPEELLKGYRGAWYMGIGLATAGLAVSVWYWLKTVVRARREGRREEKTG